MKHWISPIDLMMLSFNTTRMLAEAQLVITLRLLGMAGGMRAAPGEGARMVSEKVDAAREAGLAMARAAAGGAAAPAIAAAGLKPVARRTRANVRRLTKAPG